MSESNATFTTGDTSVELERVSATQGSDGFSIAPLLAQTGTVTLDPGFVNTASCTSNITYISGSEGIKDALVFRHEDLSVVYGIAYIARGMLDNKIIFK